jgi:hypothetical protein
MLDSRDPTHYQENKGRYFKLRKGPRYAMKSLRPDKKPVTPLYEQLEPRSPGKYLR